VYEAAIEWFEDDPSVVYVLDDDLRLAYCNKAWDEFAEHNGGAHLRRVEQLVVLQTWQPEASQFWVAPIMRRLESRIAPLRTEAVQQSPPWVTTGPDLSESYAPLRFLIVLQAPSKDRNP
jgi:hypothetical protein